MFGLTLHNNSTVELEYPVTCTDLHPIHSKEAIQ